MFIFIKVMFLEVHPSECVPNEYFMIYASAFPLNFLCINYLFVVIWLVLNVVKQIR